MNGVKLNEPYTYHTADRAQDTPENNYEVIRNFVTLVREAAPLSFDESGSTLAGQVTPPTAAPAPAAPEPSPQPAASEPSQEDAAKPRRSGWWSKRVLGG